MQILSRSFTIALCLALASGSVPAAAQSEEGGHVPKAIGGGGGLIVGGIAVDTTGKTPQDARQNGWREAQRLAWPQLWTRISGQPAESAPKLSDSTLDSMVAAIEIEREQLGPTRYVARLAVVFDRARASAHLGRYAEISTSPPLLVLPVLQDAAVRQAHEPESPWLKAWARLRAGESPIDYIRIQPTPGDVILLNAWQARRRHLPIWRDLVDRYQVADVLIPELILERSWAGGPVTGLLIVRFGPVGRELGRVRLANQSGDVDGLMDEAVRQADLIYVSALRGGHLLPDSRLLEPEAVLLSNAGPAIGFDVVASELYRLNLRVATPDEGALAIIEQQLRTIPEIASVRSVSSAPGGESVIELSSGVAMDVLRHALDGRGWRIDGNLLRPRRADEALLPPPEPEEGMIVESDSLGGIDPQGASPAPSTNVD